ncbi:hypothetical protein ACSSS7_004306 [Eimeria intestinalis]
MTAASAVTRVRLNAASVDALFAGAKQNYTIKIGKLHALMYFNSLNCSFREAIAALAGQQPVPSRFTPHLLWGLAWPRWLAGAPDDRARNEASLDARAHPQSQPPCSSSKNAATDAAGIKQQQHQQLPPALESSSISTGNYHELHASSFKRA